MDYASNERLIARRLARVEVDQDLYSVHLDRPPNVRFSLMREREREVFGSLFSLVTLGINRKIYRTKIYCSLKDRRKTYVSRFDQIVSKKNLVLSISNACTFCHLRIVRFRHLREALIQVYNKKIMINYVFSNFLHRCQSIESRKRIDYLQTRKKFRRMLRIILTFVNEFYFRRFVRL